MDGCDSRMFPNLLSIAEEVRVQLIDLLDLCLGADSSQFIPQLGALSTMFSKAAQDMNPEMKNKIATFCGKVALSLGKRIGGYFKPTVDSLVTNLAHQHSKVRKTTLRGLKDILACKGAEPFMDGNTIAQLKFTMNDRS